MEKEKEVEALKAIIIKNIQTPDKNNRCYDEAALRKCALDILENGFGKIEGYSAEIAGLTGKVEALQQDNENLRRTLEQGRSYRYRDSCAGCELEDICKYAEHYNFCEDCKEYPDCPIHVDCTECPCGRTVECNNGFEEKSHLDDEDEEAEDYE